MSSGAISSHVDGSARRLAAVLCAYIEDDSRLIGIEEAGTHERARHRREIIGPVVAQHYGQVIKNTGDGFLAIFDSPLEAVRCALAMRQSLVRRNASLPRQQWMQCCVGVDVLRDPDDIFGDGMIVAARLQSLAEPGDVYISGRVYEQVKHRLGCGYQSLGDEKFKNITDPVRIYRVLPDRSAAARAKRSSWIPYGVAVGVGVATGGVAGWYALRANSFPPAEQPPAVRMTLQSQLRPEQLLAAARPLPPQPPPMVEPPAAMSPQAPPQVAMAMVKPPRLPSRAASPYEVFRECEQCPEMVSLPGGTFAMGSNDDPTEKPAHQVTVPPFALGRSAVTIGEWKLCVAATACGYDPAGEDDMPVHNVSWNDAQQYVTWLSKITGSRYRLPTEAEWEYAARGGASTKYWWGNQLKAGMANCKDCGDAYDPRRPMKVASFASNPFGLYDMTGGVAQWVSDCWHKNYQGAPKDGSARDAPNCGERVLRGGSWRNDASYLRASSRHRYDPGVRYLANGFRVGRSPGD